MKKLLGLVLTALAIVVLLTSCGNNEDKSVEQFNEIVANMDLDSQTLEPLADTMSEGDMFIAVGNSTLIIVAVGDTPDISAIYTSDNTVVLLELDYGNIFLSKNKMINYINISCKYNEQDLEIEFVSQDENGYKCGYTKDELVEILSNLSAEDIINILKDKNIIFTID